MFRRSRQDQNSSEEEPPLSKKSGVIPQLSAKGKISTVLGPGAMFNGLLKVSGGTRIEGCFEGELQIDGPLVIGEKARIIANITAKAISVAGVVKGNVTAERVEILSSGRIYGDLITHSFSADEGGFLRGQIHMLDGDEENDLFAEVSFVTNGVVAATT